MEGRKKELELQGEERIVSKQTAEQSEKQLLVVTNSR
jgi:hypothetical protein